MLYGMRWQIQHAWAEFCTMMLFVFIGCGTAAVRSVSATQAAQHALIGAHLRIG
jgi:glycerol uptake facilitator-like aquaporin